MVLPAALMSTAAGASGRLEDIDLIDQVAGVLTPVGPMEAVISDIVFAPDGTLYGCSPTGELYSIDPVTGSKTLLFNTAILQLSGLAGAPASPTPSPTPTATPTATPTPSATPTATPTPTVTVTPTVTPTATPAHSATPRPRPTPHPRPTPYLE